jgi:glycosyltransferase involved in cell wall biosynthesis
MRILVINQFFWPDLAPTGQYLCDLTRHLAANGHEVTVICSGGAYAKPEAAGSEPPPVRMIRVPGTRFRRGALSRLVSYSAFFAGVLWHQMRVPRPDLVLTMTTPPLLSVAGWILKMLRGSRHFIWEMDLFPDVLVTVGALRENGMITRILGWISDRSRRRSDGVIVLGPCMRERVMARGIPADLIHVAENWADGNAILPGPERSGSGPLHIFYSGNLGMAHDVDTIAGAISRFRNDARFQFTFAGSGVGREQLQKQCAAEGIRNVSFPPYAEKGGMSAHLAQADIGLVTERPACVGTVVPSKVYGLMAAAKPLLFIGPPEATPGLAIARFQCGWQIAPGDVPGLIALLEDLAVRRDEVRSYGRRAREVFEQHYDLPDGVARVAAALGAGSPQTAPGWAPELC